MSSVLNENLESSPIRSWKPAQTIRCEINDPDSSSDEEEVPAQASFYPSQALTHQLPRLKPNACVFVGCMPTTFQDEELAHILSNIFAPFGPVMSLKLLRDRQNRPYSFVQLLTQQNAQRAISQLNRYDIGTRQILCEPARVNRTLHIEGKSLDVGQLFEFAEQFGEIEQAETEDEANCSVMYEYREDAVRAYHEMSQLEELRVQWIRNIEPCTASNETIFIGGLPLSTSLEDLETLLGRHGRLVWCDIRHMDVTSDSVYAIVCLASKATAASIIECMNHTYFRGRVIKVQKANRQLGSGQAPSVPRLPVGNIQVESAPRTSTYRKIHTKISPLPHGMGGLPSSEGSRTRALRRSGEKE